LNFKSDLQGWRIRVVENKAWLAPTQAGRAQFETVVKQIIQINKIYFAVKVHKGDSTPLEGIHI
jgi:hypothetical protein